jgi:methionine synthase I (cobalamin-dependent)
VPESRLDALARGHVPTVRRSYGYRLNVSPSFLDLLDERRVLVADGATGTNYQEVGLEAGKPPEEWVLASPDRVVGLHREFVDAGADLVLTCTFGATSVRLEDSPLAGRAQELNLRAVELAREAAGERVLVAGSLGPTGKLFEPYGPLDHETAVAAYREQAETLTEGGADLLVLETFFALEEATAAVEGVQAGSQLPLVVAFSFDQGTRTMMGLSPADVVHAFAGRGLAALGANCGRSLADTDLVVGELLAAGGGAPVWVKPNAGVPKMVEGRVVYEADPETLASHARAYVEQGARIVGGCCGSTPEHIRAIAAAVAPLR